MKVTFIVPPPLDSKLPAERIFGCNYGIYYQPNIFILYSLSVLKEIGCEVKFFDCVINNFRKKDFLNYIRNNDSNIYVFYTVFLSKTTDLKARALIRSIRPYAKFIYLSTEPTSNPEEFADKDSYVIRGEPEHTIKELISVLKDRGNIETVKGISYFKNGKIISNEQRELVDDLDKLPFPDRSFIQKEKYYNPKLTMLPFTAVLSSRGCPHRCYYCVPNSLNFAREIEYKRGGKGKPPIRMRSAENVIEEIRQLFNYGYKSFSFIDDEFAIDKNRVMKICEGIKEFNFEWSCLARADHLTDEHLIKSMAEAGCKYIDIGIESFDQKILNFIKKDLKIGDIYKAVETLKNNDIEPELNILLGSCILETRETIRYTIDEVKKLDVDYVLFSICTPFPNTEFYAMAKEKGFMVEKEYRAIDPIKESFISYPHLKKDELEKIIRQAYTEFYFRPSYIIKRLRKLRGFKDFINKAKAAFSILR